MAKKKSHSRELRRLAEQLVRTFETRGKLPERAREELTTSLVRQWLTYDGNATLYAADHQFFFTLSRTPLGKLGQPLTDAPPSLKGNLPRLLEEWKIAPTHLREIIQQLNRGQSAQITNEAGIPLRLWTDPKTRSSGVEPLVPMQRRPKEVHDLRKIARQTLEQEFGRQLDPEELEQLIASVLRQWETCEGHAGLFTVNQQVSMVIAHTPEGPCRLETQRQAVDFRAVLAPQGFAPEDVPEVLARLNLGECVEYRDPSGAAARLWLDPRQGLMHGRSPTAPRPETPSNSPPFLCPRCSAVLLPWQPDEWEQTCPQCGEGVRLSR